MSSDSGLAQDIVNQVGENGGNPEDVVGDVVDNLVQDTLADIFSGGDSAGGDPAAEFGEGASLDLNFTEDLKLNDTSGVAFQVVFEAVRSSQKIQDRFYIWFDHTHNLSAVLDDSGDRTYVDNAKEYLYGLIFLGALMLVFFLLWGLFILCASCGVFGGRKRLGFMSGKPFVRKVKHRRNPNVVVQRDDMGHDDEDDEDMDEVDMDDEDDSMYDSSFQKRVNDKEQSSRVSFVSALHEEEEEDEEEDRYNDKGEMMEEQPRVPTVRWQDDVPTSTKSQNVIPEMKQGDFSGGDTPRENSTFRSHDTLRDEPMSVRPGQTREQSTLRSHDTLRDEPLSNRATSTDPAKKEMPTWAVAVARLFQASDTSDDRMVPPLAKPEPASMDLSSASSTDSDASTLFVDDADFLKRPDASQFLPKRRFPKAYDHWGDPWRSRATKTRLVFITSGIICVTFGILMVAQGITELQTGINTVHETTTNTFVLADTSLTLIRDAVADVGASANNVRELLDEDLDNSPENADGYCPGNPQITNTQDLIDTGITDIDTGIPGVDGASDTLDDTLSDAQGFEQEIQRLKGLIVEMLDEFDDLQEGLIADFEGIMEDVAEYSETVSNESDNYSFLDWQSLIVLIPYTVFPTLLVTGALLALYDVSHPGFQCFLNFFVLPIFILMTIVAFTFASIMVIMAGVNADFCLPGGQEDSSPDKLILGVIQVFGYDPGSFIYDIADWYISQCGAQDPLSELRAYQTELAEGVTMLDSVLGDVVVLDRLNELEVFCNRDFAILEPLLLNLLDMLQVLLELLVTLLDLTKCARIIPIYTDTVYKAGCEYSPRAVFWVWSGTLILGFFGMVMISLRSAMKSTIILEKGTTIKSSEHFVDEEGFEPNEEDGEDYGEEENEDREIVTGDALEEEEASNQNIEEMAEQEENSSGEGEPEETNSSNEPTVAQEESQKEQQLEEDSRAHDLEEGERSPVSNEGEPKLKSEDNISAAPPVSDVCSSDGEMEIVFDKEDLPEKDNFTIASDLQNAGGTE